MKVRELREGEDKAVHRLLEAAGILDELGASPARIEEALAKDQWIAGSKRRYERFLIPPCM